MYPERKPIYEAYKKIIHEIIESKIYREYADSEIDSLDKELLNAFKDIRNAAMLDTDWKS